MAENSPSGKRKTLYGRYDDYAASEEDSAAGGNILKRHTPVRVMNIGTVE